MTLTKNSVAVITGAASDIGRALALRLAKEGISGLAIADVNAEGLKETADLVAQNGLTPSPHVVNVGDREQMREFAEDVLKEHGKVTHLINNAGVGLIGSFEQISIEDMEW